MQEIEITKFSTNIINYLHSCLLFSIQHYNIVFQTYHVHVNPNLCSCRSHRSLIKIALKSTQASSLLTRTFNAYLSGQLSFLLGGWIFYPPPSPPSSSYLVGLPVGPIEDWAENGANFSTNGRRPIEAASR